MQSFNPPKKKSESTIQFEIAMALSSIGFEVHLEYRIDCVGVCKGKKTAVIDIAIFKKGNIVGFLEVKTPRSIRQNSDHAISQMMVNTWLWNAFDIPSTITSSVDHALSFVKRHCQ